MLLVLLQAPRLERRAELARGQHLPGEVLQPGVVLDAGHALRVVPQPLRGERAGAGPPRAARYEDRTARDAVAVVESNGRGGGNYGKILCPAIKLRGTSIFI